MLSKLPRTLSVGLTALLAIIPFIPLYVSPSLLFPYITGKTFLFRILVEFALVLWVGLAFLDKKYRPKFSPLVIAMAAFLLIMTVADLFGSNWFRSLWSNYERMEGLVGLLHLGAFFLMLTTVFRAKEWKLFFNLTIIAAALNGAYALFQKWGLLRSIQGGFRTEGMIGNPTYFAGYLLLVCVVALLLLLQSEKRWQKYLYSALTAFFFLIIIFTATRGVMIGIVGGVLLFALGLSLWGKRAGISKRLRTISLVLLVAAIVVPVSLWLMRDTAIVKKSEVLSRFTSISLTDKTTRARFMIWGMALEAAKERPVLGWGQENFIEGFTKYYNPNLFDQEAWFDRTHNVFLDWLIAGGILGLLAYLGLFGASLYELVRARKGGSLSLVESLVIGAGLIAYFIQNLFVFDSLVTYIMFFTLLAYIYHRHHAGTPEKAEVRGEAILPSALGIIAITLPIVGFGRAFGFFEVMVPLVFFGSYLAYLFMSRLGENREVAEINTANRALMGGGAALIGMLAIFYFANYTPMAQAKELIALLNMRMAQETVPDIITQTKGAIDRGGFGISEIREQMGQRSQEILDPRLVAFMLEQFETHLADFPNDPRARLFAAMLYVRAATQNPLYLSKAKEHFDYALSQGPKRQVIHLARAEYFLKGGQTTEAIQSVQAAIDLAPQFDEPYAAMVQIAIVAGQKALADTVLKEHPTESVRLRAAETYIQDGNKSAAAAMFEGLAKENPDSVEYHARLADLYAELARYTEAIKHAEEIIRIDPGQYTEQGNAFIAEMKRRRGY